jgi:hypothetical protein
LLSYALTATQLILQNFQCNEENPLAAIPMW